MRRLVKIMLATGAILLLLAGIWWSNRQSAEPLALPISLATLEQIDSGRISFEERGESIFVWVTDRYGDAHMRVLSFEGVSRQKALEALTAKQSELETVVAEPSTGGNR